MSARRTRPSPPPSPLQIISVLTNRFYIAHDVAARAYADWLRLTTDTLPPFPTVAEFQRAVDALNAARSAEGAAWQRYVDYLRSVQIPPLPPQPPDPRPHRLPFTPEDLIAPHARTTRTISITDEETSIND